MHFQSKYMNELPPIKNLLQNCKHKLEQIASLEPIAWIFLVQAAIRYEEWTTNNWGNLKLTSRWNSRELLEKKTTARSLQVHKNSLPYFALQNRQAEGHTSPRTATWMHTPTLWSLTQTFSRISTNLVSLHKKHIKDRREPSKHTSMRPQLINRASADEQ